MSGDQRRDDELRRSGERAREETAGTEFEERLRELLAEDAYTVRPSPAPYPAVRRRGVVERRRRAAATGAVLAALATVPVGAYALTGTGGPGTDTAAPGPSVSSAAPSPSTAPSGPARPATGGQLLDGITYERAASGLEACLAYDRAHTPGDRAGTDLGDSAGYRVLLAMRSTGDSNAPGDGHFVVAVKERPVPVRIICTVKDGEVAGINVTRGESGVPDAGPVRPDDNGQKLYMQSVLDKGRWKLPFRWGSVGRVDPSVARVTVDYGGRTSEAVLDRGWFAAVGVLTEQVTLAPHIKGYDAGGKLVYDSDDDRAYSRTLP
ncbi:hypothetical protein ACIF8T_02070 [Streptomyces sp. NPDC085946]|uniref:hypothetical protein n=1 Tax=Streptomyces sp. NPDC085946 TaxID=3365744 RepID=UPI0037D212AB